MHPTIKSIYSGLEVLTSSIQNNSALKVLPWKVLSFTGSALGVTCLLEAGIANFLAVETLREAVNPAVFLKSLLFSILPDDSRTLLRDLPVRDRDGGVCFEIGKRVRPFHLRWIVTEEWAGTYTSFSLLKKTAALLSALTIPTVKWYSDPENDTSGLIKEYTNEALGRLGRPKEEMQMYYNIAASPDIHLDGSHQGITGALRTGCNLRWFARVSKAPCKCLIGAVQMICAIGLALSLVSSVAPFATGAAATAWIAQTSSALHPVLLFCGSKLLTLSAL